MKFFKSRRAAQREARNAAILTAALGMGLGANTAAQTQGRTAPLNDGVSAVTAAGDVPGISNVLPPPPPIDATNWGTVTAPVYNQFNAGSAFADYAIAELFAGPNQFGSYYAGVLPDGKIVRPAGVAIQIGMNPMGAALTPDGRFLITLNSDEREGGFVSLNPTPAANSGLNKGGYSVSVVDTATMKIVSQLSVQAYIGLQVTGPVGGPYIVWASGGPTHVVRRLSVNQAGVIDAASSNGTIAINPITPANQGYVSNYNVAASFAGDAPSQFSKTGAKLTCPAGSAFSPDGKLLYVACNTDNSLAIIDTTTFAVVKQIPVGYFPYAVSVSSDGGKVFVSNWGMTEYKFANPTYDNPADPNAKITAIGATSNTNPATSGGPIAPNLPDGFYVPATNTAGSNPKTSSVTIVSVPGGVAANAVALGSIYEGKPLDALNQVGDTHPSATAIVKRGTVSVLYVAKANDNSLGMILVSNNRKLPDFDLSPIPVNLPGGQRIVGSYPNALAASADGSRLYVAEAGTNTVAVLDTTTPTAPKVIGRIPTGWYPVSVTLSADGNTLYITNAKGIGEDINPATDFAKNPTATGVESYTDGNFIFGSLQKVDLTKPLLPTPAAMANVFSQQPPNTLDSSIVPLGIPAGVRPGSPQAGSQKIKHVIFILHENKTFDSMLGNRPAHFGNFASLKYNNTAGTAAPNGITLTNSQYTPVSLNTQALALSFATAVNYYFNSEESDAGHQYSASGTASDYTQKTLLNKTGRGMFANKNFEPEDYPAGGYIFNNAARNGVSFKDYGALVRIQGTDTGANFVSTPANPLLNDPTSGKGGYPDVTQTTANNVVNVPNSDVTSATSGLGQSYFQALPILAILGGANQSGEPHLDANYPGYNFSISDQRRALEFIKDFDRMTANGTLPQFLYLYQPNDHTGTPYAPTTPATPTATQEVEDGDVGLGMVISHIMKTPTYYNPADGTGSAIFITYDDAQSTLDHIHQHRTPLIVVSPYAKSGGVGQGFVGTRHYVTASVVKTEELLLGLPPLNYGDLTATDLRDLFQSTYNGITANQLTFNKQARYVPTTEGRKVWALAKGLDSSGPDKDSRRLGALARLSMAADDLHKTAAKQHTLNTATYRKAQTALYAKAEAVVKSPKVDADGD